MKRLLYVFSFFFVFFLFPAYAQIPVHAELVAEKGSISAGEETYLALKLSLPKRWHVYWKNPGDAGEATELKLSLPEGFQEEGRFWPVPEKFRIGTLTEYGYRNNAYLLVKIKAPETLQPGVAAITGKASWLACRDECVPMSANVSTFLMAGESEGKNAEISGVLANLPAFQENAVFFETPDEIVLRLPLETEAEKVYFFAESPRLVTHAGEQKAKIKDGDFYLFMPKAAPEDFQLPDRIKGNAVFYNVQGEPVKSVEIAALKTDEKLPVFSVPFVFSDFAGALLLALAGGLLLNLMPCVFPVLSLKAFALISDKGEDAASERRKSGLAYTAGVLVSFAVIGCMLIALRAAGTELGWGFQLQYPPFVLALCLFLFFLGLLFSDVVTIGSGLASFGMNMKHDWGSFGTGVLAVFVATPCAAPFMGTALGYGLMNPAPVTMAVFMAMGLGLSLPFLFLGFYPSLCRFLPKPGTWMVMFRRFLAFPLYAAAAWLLWVLAAQEGSPALALGFVCLLLTAFSAWLSGEAERMPRLLNWSRILIIFTFLFIGIAVYRISPVHLEQKNTETVNWIPYDSEKIEEYRAQGVPVFIKFSAKWCLTCLLNEKTAFASGAVAEDFRKKGVAAFSADWTTRNDGITAALESFGRGGIPLYVYYGPHDSEPVILPQVITENTVLELTEAL